jgi:hypothetical protein
MVLSLGKIDYCIYSLLKGGFVRFSNFSKSSNRYKYAFNLSLAGLDEKIHITLGFLNRQEADFEAINREIKSLIGVHESGKSKHYGEVTDEPD